MKPTAWSVKAPAWAHPPHHLQDWHAFNTRMEAIMPMGEAWKKDGETWREGWRRAYRAGFRAVRVCVTETSK